MQFLKLFMTTLKVQAVNIHKQYDFFFFFFWRRTYLFIKKEKRKENKKKKMMEKLGWC